MRSSSGAEEAAPTRPRTGAARRASASAERASLPLKDLILVDGDGLAPPALIARQGDVLTRHHWLGAVPVVAEGEEHVVPGGEVRPVGPPDVPFLTRRAARRRYQRPTHEEQPHALASHRLAPPRMSEQPHYASEFCGRGSTTLRPC